MCYALTRCRASVPVASTDIERASLHVWLPWYNYLYTVPFFSLYPVLAYAYFVKYDEWLGSEEWTFLACTTLGVCHALSFLSTRWHTGARAWITTRKVCAMSCSLVISFSVLAQASSIEEANCIRIVPKVHRGQGDIVPLERRDASDSNSYTFSFQRDTYIIVSTDPLTFGPLLYPSSNKPPLETFLKPNPLQKSRLEALARLYGDNAFNIPIPTFSELFSEQATAPFFVFQVFCVGLWCLDEYWYYSLFTLFMLIVFECTVVWQVSFCCCIDAKCHFLILLAADSYTHGIQDYVCRSISYPLLQRFKMD